MRDTLIEQEDGFLGPFPRILKPGDIQSTVFGASDSVPFWLSDQQGEDSRLDVQLGTANIVQRKMNEIVELLTAAGVLGTEGKTIRQLKDLCIDHGILTFKSVLISVERNRAEFELSLRGKGVGTIGKNKRELVELCEHHSIVITKTVEKIREGWEGTPKGVLQRKTSLEQSMRALVACGT